MAFAGKIPQTHNNETQSLTFTETLKFNVYETQKRPKSQKL